LSLRGPPDGGLRAFRGASDAEFEAALAQAIDEIYQASTVKA
jgi:hypothetical protein